MPTTQKAKRRILFAGMHRGNLFQEQELRGFPLGSEPAVPSAPRWGGLGVPRSEHTAPLNREPAAGILQTFGTNLRPPVPGSGTDAIPRH